MFLKQTHKQNVKISNREASNKGLHRVRRVQMQRQFGVINKNNLVVGGMRRKRCQAAFVEQTAFLSARMKDSKSKLVERGTRVCDLLRPASVQVPRSTCGALCMLVPFRRSERNHENKACFFATFSTCGVTAVEACVEMCRSV